MVNGARGADMILQLEPSTDSDFNISFLKLSKNEAKITIKVKQIAQFSEEFEILGLSTIRWLACQNGAQSLHNFLFWSPMRRQTIMVFNLITHRFVFFYRLID